MKRFSLALLAVLIAIASGASLACAQYAEGCYAAADEEVVVIPQTVPSRAHLELTIPRVEESARLLIQMREIFEWLGWVVEWQTASQTIDAYQEGYHMVLQVNNHLAVVNGKMYDLDVPPRLLLSKTFVPLRFVAEVTGCQVDYHGNVVIITDQDGSTMTVRLVR